MIRLPSMILCYRSPDTTVTGHDFSVITIRPFWHVCQDKKTTHTGVKNTICKLKFDRFFLRGYNGNNDRSLNNPKD